MIAPSRYPGQRVRRQRFASLQYQRRQRSASFQVNSGPIFDASFSLPSPWFASVDDSTANQACKNEKSLERDHRNRNRNCASPMLLRTGLGSNSSTGFESQTPMGIRPTLTAAVSCILRSRGTALDILKFLTVIGPACRLELLLSRRRGGCTVKKSREASISSCRLLQLSKPCGNLDS